MDDKSQNPQTQVVYVKNGDNESKPMTVGSWIVTFILLAIPMVNVIFFFVWCCGAGNKSRVSYVRTILLGVVIIGVIIGILIAAIPGLLETISKTFETVTSQL